MKLFLTDWRFAVLAIYAIAVGAMLIIVGDPQRLEWWPGGIGFWLFTLVPVAILCFGSKHVRVKGLAVVAMAAGGIWGYYNAMFGEHTSSTSALVFVVLPVYQLIGSLAFLALLWAIDRFVKGDEE